MPVYRDSLGYDRLWYWTRMELRQFYQAEGYSTEEAIKMAKALYQGILNLNRRELYSWSKARELEELSGNASDLEEIAANYAYDYLDYGDDVWNEIESFAMPDKREIAHYERLRGHRMRLSPEVKAANEGAREKAREEFQGQEKETQEEFLSIISERLEG